jgi:hypothetical protein
VELTITVSKCADFGCRAALVQHGNIRLPEYLQDLMPMGVGTKHKKFNKKEKTKNMAFESWVKFIKFLQLQYTIT